MRGKVNLGRSFMRGLCTCWNWAMVNWNESIRVERFLFVVGDGWKEAWALSLLKYIDMFHGCKSQRDLSDRTQKQKIRSREDGCSWWLVGWPWLCFFSHSSHESFVSEDRWCRHLGYEIDQPSQCWITPTALQVMSHRENGSSQSKRESGRRWGLFLLDWLVEYASDWIDSW